MSETCLIVDGNSLLYRAFHALPLMDVDGVYTNAVHGFMMMLLRAMQEHAPSYCVVAFDEHGPTFRHEEYDAYKAGRAPTPDALRPQFDLLKEILSAAKIGVISLAGYEADDLLGTISANCEKENIQSLLLTGDRDALQLVSKMTSLLYTRKGISEITFFTPAVVEDEYGITPEQVTDWKGLMGDSSDNIPGIPGVGEKTSIKLLKQYQSLENVLSHADEIKGKLGENIRNNKEMARFSKKLATICRTAPIHYQLSDWRLTHLDEALPTLHKYRMNTVSERLEKLTGVEHQAAQTPSVQWKTAKSARDIQSFIEQLNDDPLFILITEQGFSLCQGEKYLKASFATGQQSFFEQDGDLTIAETLSHLKPLLQRPLITHEGKALLHYLRAHQIAPPPLYWDTMIAAYLLNPQEKSYALSNFAEDSAAGVQDLYRKQRKHLQDQQMMDLYQDIELPLVNVLYSMEEAGFQVDAKVLEQLGTTYVQRTKELEEKIFDSCDVGPFNINSPQQLGKVLFEKLGLPPHKKTSRGFSTDAESLEAILDHHPAIASILEYRQIMKLNGTYIEPLLRNQDSNGRIHTTFDQTGTSTGRISSNEPNLQNIPIRTPLGREIRRAFVAKKGYVLVDGDYSQIELRILAHMSEDPAMCDAFLQKQDIHARTAAEVEGIPLEEVSPAQRSAAKAVNFGIVYGISDFGLARNIGISRKQAGDFIARYFERYPGVHAFMEQAKKEGYEKGYAQTLYGRRRPLPELSKRNFNVRSFGERAAMNTPIQGTAADIIKAAMVKVHNELRRQKLSARLILQVHDELIIESPEEEAEVVCQLLRECMENIITLKVPLVCEVRFGKSWYESK